MQDRTRTLTYLQDWRVCTRTQTLIHAHKHWSRFVGNVKKSYMERLYDMNRNRQWNKLQLQANISINTTYHNLSASVFIYLCK